VAALDPEVARWAVGDKVTALLGGGGYAEYAVVDARHALPVPPGLDFVQAAALPETAFTVFSNVFEVGRLKAGETLLLHGATSGIGVMAIQQAKAAGARVIATSRGADKAAKALQLGADRAIDTTTEDFVAAAKEEGGVDVVLDMVGGDLVPRNLEALRPDGRAVVIAVQGGARAEIDVAKLMVRRLTLAGTTLRPRSPDEKARLAREVEAAVWPWIAAGKVAPVIDRTFPLTEAAAAHAWLESGHHVGKVVLVP
jgi:putative PIG3 family NAD(P)H quinone oxidoreductase